MPAQSSLYARIFRPFCIAVIAASVIAWGTAYYLVDAALQRDRIDQLESGLATIAEAGLPLTAQLLQRIARLQQAELILVGEQDEILLSTIGVSSAVREIVDQSAAVAGRAAAGDYTHVTLNDETFVVVRVAVPDLRSSRISSVILLGSLEAARGVARQIAVWLSVFTTASVIALAFWGHRITRSIAQPIARLGQTARAIGAGTRVIDVTQSSVREVSGLADAIAAMATQLEDFERELAERNKLAALGEIASQVAHEIRNPLTAIQLELQMLGERVEDDLSSASIQRVLAELQRLKMVVTNTLAVRRDAAIERRPTQLNDIVHDVAGLMSPSLLHRGIGLHTELNALPVADLDGDRFKQVIFNAVTNAAEAMPDGGTIRVTTSSADDGQVLELAIEDEGAGFDQQVLAQLNQGVALTTKSGGSGLGLMVSREVIEQHGGTIEFVRSANLGGARVIIRIPVHPA